MVGNFKNSLTGITITKVIMYLTLSDIFTWGLYTVVNVFVGLYLEDKFNGNALQYIGIGISILFISKAISQIPIGIITDRIQTYKDDILVLFLGNALMAVPFFFYPVVTTPIFYYFLQMILGIGMSMNLVSWRKTFAENLEPGKEGISYAVYDTITSLAVTLFGIIIGYVANLGNIYFELMLVVIGLCMLSSGFWIKKMYFVLEYKNKNKI